jgi:hypothetical protein
MFIKFSLPIFCFIFFQLHSIDEDPYVTLGLSQNPTVGDIKKRCHELFKKHHPDKGGNKDDFIRVSHACQEAQKKNSTPQPPPTPKSGAQNKFDFDNFFKEFARAYGRNNQQSEPKKETFNIDGCMKQGDPCTCSNTGLEGTCGTGFIKEGLYCQCKVDSYPPENENDIEDEEQPFYESRKQTTFDEPPSYEFPKQTVFDDVPKWNSTDFHQKTTERLHHEIDVFSRTIQAPIYSIPLARALMPFYVCESGITRWSIAVAPFIKTPATAFEGRFQKVEFGSLIASRLTMGRVWLDITTSFAAVDTKYTSRSGDYHYSDKHFGLIDALFAIGTGMGSENKQLDLKALLGVTGNPNSHIIDPRNILVLPHASIGIQADGSWMLIETQNSQLNLVTTLRDLYFLKTEVTLDNQQFSSHIGTHHIKPGNFIDILLALEQCLGTDRQHHFEVGYNPSFHTGGESTLIKAGTNEIELHLNHHQEPRERHTIYGTYTYDFPMVCDSASWGIGFSVTFLPKTTQMIPQQTALVWTTLSIAF